jgi:hypothetical protein
MPATATAMASQVPAPLNRMADGSTGACGLFGEAGMGELIASPVEA